MPLKPRAHRAAALAAALSFAPVLAQGEIRQIAVPAAAVEQAMATRVAPASPRQYAVAVPLLLTPAAAEWRPDGDALVWRAAIRSAGATSLSLRLAALQGATVRILDPAGHLVHGPYGAADAGADGLWTPIVPGEELSLEARAPVGAPPVLHVATVYHGFRDWRAAAQGKSGSCNIDVACPQGDGWRDPIRAVARITVGGEILCTGQLMNNVRQDDTPYFLTANHCGIGDEPGDIGPASSVVFYWNYQTTSCGGSPDGDLSQTQSGSEFVADDAGSDFTLVRINSAPPPAYNVHYAGWNAALQAPQSGAGIHHPQGDEKRISLFASPPQAIQGQFPGSDAPIAGWQVQWSQGVTEEGSSGSGLWDQNRRVVGVLSYGSASCDNPNGSDVYGRLDAAWTAAPEPSGQLKAHLDPDGTGTVSLDGRGGVSTGGQAPPDQSYNVGALPLPLLLLLGLLGLRRPHHQQHARQREARAD